MKPLAVFVVVCIGIAMIPDRKQEPIDQPSVVQFEELPIVRTLPVAMTSPAVEDEPKKLEVIEPTDKYEVARDRAEKEDKPLVAYVGARWCGPCKQMKREVLQPMIVANELQEVVFVELDYDQDAIAQTIVANGSGLPQLVAYRRVKGWKPFTKIGYQTREQVRTFIRTVVK